MFNDSLDKRQISLMTDIYITWICRSWSDAKLWDLWIGHLPSLPTGSEHVVGPRNVPLLNYQNCKLNAERSSQIPEHQPLGYCSQHYDNAHYIALVFIKANLKVFTFQDLAGIYSARQFVGWYNGLPDLQDLSKSFYFSLILKACRL